MDSAPEKSSTDKKSVPVAFVARRMGCSRDTVLRLLQSGELKGYRLTPNGWWRVIEDSFLEYKERIERLLNL
jgi:excisionase family DNA binding protein